MATPDVIHVPHKVQVVIEPRALDIETACQVYSVSRSTLEEWRRQGFPIVKVGRKPLVPVAQADAWLAAHITQEATPS